MQTLPRTYLRFGGRVWHREKILGYRLDVSMFLGRPYVEVDYADDTLFPAYAGHLIHVPFMYMYRSRRMTASLRIYTGTSGRAVEIASIISRACPNLDETVWIEEEEEEDEM